jgi:hypothetical protein
VQGKLANVINLAIESMDDNNLENIAGIAAFARSAFQDVLEQRRIRLAGFSGGKLDPRPDVAAARLLSPEEEKRIKPWTKNTKGGGKGGGSDRSGGSGGQGGFSSSGRFFGSSSSSRSSSNWRKSNNWRDRSQSRGRDHAKGQQREQK